MSFIDSADKRAEQRGKFLVFHRTLTQFAIQSCLTPLFPHDIVWKQMLRLSIPQSFAPTPTSIKVQIENAACVSWSYKRGGRGGHRAQPRCHVDEQCVTKANQLQPWVMNVAKYQEYLKLKTNLKSITCVASIAQTGNLQVKDYFITTGVLMLIGQLHH